MWISQKRISSVNLKVFFQSLTTVWLIISHSEWGHQIRVHDRRKFDWKKVCMYKAKRLEKAMHVYLYTCMHMCTCICISSMTRRPRGIRKINKGTVRGWSCVVMIIHLNTHAWFWDTYALSFTHTKTQVQSYMMIHTRTWAYHLRTRWVPKYFFWSFVSKKYPPSDELEWKHLPLLRIRFSISNRSKNLQGRSSLSNQSSKRTASGRGSLQSLTTMTHQTWKIGALFRSACARAREGETVRAKARARERG